MTTTYPALIFDKLRDLDDRIDSVENKSDSYTARARIKFKNGYQLSVIKGLCTYGGESDLYEIAIIDTRGGWCPELFDEADQGDEVLGYCDEHKVRHYIDKIARLP